MAPPRAFKALILAFFIQCVVCHCKLLADSSARLVKVTVRMHEAFDSETSRTAWFRDHLPDSEVVAIWDDATDQHSTALVDVFLPEPQLPVLKSLQRLAIESVAPGGPFRSFHKRERGGPSSRAAAADDYHSPEAIVTQLQALERSHPDLAMMQNLTKMYDLPLTVDGNSLHAFKVSANVRVDEDEPNMLLVSNHHSRELVTPELALDAAIQLTKGYASREEGALALLDSSQIYIMWTMNPDGLAYTWDSDRWWRKNRKRNSGGSYGVDLNRNYPVGWDFSCSGSTSQPSQTYRGTGPLSEVETRVMAAFHKDRQFSHVMDYHSFAREVRINYGSCAKLPRQIDDLFRETASEIASVLQYRQARSCCMGGQVHNAYHEHGSLAFLTETATSFQPPPAAMRQEVERVRPGTLAFFQLPIPVVGHVFSVPGPTQGGVREALAGAKLTIAELEFELDETPGQSNTRGRYHLWLPQGTWTITASKEGYQSTTQSVSVTAGQTTIVDFSLESLA